MIVAIVEMTPLPGRGCSPHKRQVMSHNSQRSDECDTNIKEALSFILYLVSFMVYRLSVICYLYAKGKPLESK